MKLNVRKTNIKQRKQGFLARMRTRGGRQVIKRQRAKGKKYLGK
jgi:large subunit ribosomal protein L34